MPENENITFVIMVVPGKGRQRNEISKSGENIVI